MFMHAPLHLQSPMRIIAYLFGCVCVCVYLCAYVWMQLLTNIHCCMYMVAHNALICLHAHGRLCAYENVCMVDACPYGNKIAVFSEKTMVYKVQPIHLGKITEIACSLH